MKFLNALLLLLAAQFVAPVAAAQAMCPGNGAGNPGCAGAGNPINVITGNKFQREVDLPPLPGVMGLEVVRYYNSALSGINQRNGILGRGWRLSYETTIAAIGDTVQVLEADGTRLIFARDLLRPSLCSGGDPANGEIDVRRTPNGDEYVWRKTNGQRLSFNSQGRLVQILAPTGEFVSMQHDARGWLVKVTDPQGRSLKLNYLDRQEAAKRTRFSGVQSIDTPVGRFMLGYGSALPKGADPANRRELLANLVQVGMPDGRARQYHYEDHRFPTLMTGISVVGPDLQGKTATQRYATFGYDNNAKAVLSTHANNVGRVTLDNTVGGQTVLTNSLGEKTAYRYSMIAGELRLQDVRGAGCALCSSGANVRYGYDRYGRISESVRLAADGSTPLEATRSERDGFGRITRISRIVYRGGKPGPAQLRVRYEYAGRGASPVVIARPSVVAGEETQTRIQFNDAGQPLAVTDVGWTPGVEGKEPVPITRTTTYSYIRINGRSMLSRVDGPLKNGRANTPFDSDITEFSYDYAATVTDGQLQPRRRPGVVTRIIAPGGRVTDILERDEAGRPMRIRAPSGMDLTFEYDRNGTPLQHPTLSGPCKRPISQHRSARAGGRKQPVRIWR
jgi:YD repeat-containing protein